MKWSIKHADALHAVFTALNTNGIEWMVLRNYEGLPEENRSKDIDLVFNKPDFPIAKKIITEVLRELGFSRYTESIFQCIWCYSFFNIEASEMYSIKIDLLDGFVWRGAQVISFTNLYERRALHLDFFVPDPVYDGFDLWVKPLLTGGFIKEKYRSRILIVLKQFPKEFYSLLVSTFGSEMAGEIWPLLEVGNLDGTVEYQKRLCFSAWMKSLRRNYKITISSAVEHFYREILRRIFRKKVSMISVIGPDGVGKSTFIELLHRSMSNYFFREHEDVRVVHFRPNIFPNIKKLLGGEEYAESSEVFTNPHRAIPVGKCSSLARITYYWLDYFLGYWIKIRKDCISGKIYIFDRYFYDFIVDPYRSRIKLPKRLRLFFLMMTPEPDVVFFLNCEAATIYTRKQELTKEEIARQLEAYKKLASESKRFVILDARKKPAELCADAIRHLIEKSSKAL